MNRTGWAALLGLMLSLPPGAAWCATFLTYLNAPSAGQPILEPPRLFLSADGGAAVAAVMDTGSTGVVLSASRIPGFDALPGPPGRIAYSSSGRIETGRWVRIPIRVTGANGAQIATRPLPVLAVTAVSCMAAARNCRPRDMPDDVAMIGIGFGREADHQPQSTPDRNPFLSVPGQYRGYLITREGVTIGAGATTEGFARVSLTRSRRWPDWEGVPACITVDGAAPACGSALADTGVTAMYLSVPIPVGRDAAIAIAIPSPTGPAAAFAVAGAMRPSRIVAVHDAKPFVNLTVRFLNGYDYLYDAQAGQVGFRARTPPAASGASPR